MFSTTDMSIWTSAQSERAVAPEPAPRSDPRLWRAGSAPRQVFDALWASFHRAAARDGELSPPIGEAPSPTEMRLKLLLMRQLLIDLALNAQFLRNDPNRAPVAASGAEPIELPLRLELGVHCQETEYLRANVIDGQRRVLSALDEEVEPARSIALEGALGALWAALWRQEDVDLVATQIVYADRVYDALPRGLDRALGALAAAGVRPSHPERWFAGYTWLYGDRDGRPYDTNAHTERVAAALEDAVRANYRRDVAALAAAFPDEPLYAACLRKLDPADADAFSSPDQFVATLRAGAHVADRRVQDLLRRVQAFGFHFLKVEFRQNALKFEEVVDAVLSQETIEQRLGERAGYAELSVPKRLRLLTALLQDEDHDLPARLWNDYWSAEEPRFRAKQEAYAGGDYIELFKSDPDYIRAYDARMTYDCLRMIARYGDRMTMHGIAELEDIDAALALLFLFAAAGARHAVDIALQPEDMDGAVALEDAVARLYENPAYREHLRVRGDVQYVTFGPSDTGKAGGKAMHKANMKIARRHREIASAYGIELVPNIVIGHEHARCNGPQAEILEEYGAADGDAVRYMLSGCIEMRSFLLTLRMAEQSIANILTAQGLRAAEARRLAPAESQARAAEGREIDWLAIVRLYKSRFFDHPSLPALLKAVARFDLVRATAKGTRPPSRNFLIKDLESDPASIRAIPWTRAIMLCGLHHELIGASTLADRDAGELAALAKADRTFSRYVTNVAYAAARSNLELAWRTLGGAPLSRADVEAFGAEDAAAASDPAAALLAFVHLEYVAAKRFVFKTTRGREPADAWAIRTDELLADWPELRAEVAWKEAALAPYHEFLVTTRRDPDALSRNAIHDLYSGYLLSANTDLSLVHPETARALNWS
ncbi:phosphoenolpyruvate carboxylase [Methylopila capsulata]|uniref:Phosphoenolpyruvate carboxylase n=1 Tax=Methylopila capsulata TaxID=61654 RepID=A0A9W6IWM4_9HYPH|nr:phosphoenolpyruvate carboxylase [Methylopila capsulata]MBM7852425.1 phosphoenolpyruvate carboxylase [Methylopila capsulata]GLK56634.1 hypothetical protein GCM10008170_26530 [Methylopila capsulata]